MVETLLAWSSDAYWIYSALLVGVVLVAIWLSTAIYYAQRGYTIAARLNDSARGDVVFGRTPGPRGFFAQIEPAPEPYWRFSIAYHTTPNPLEWLIRRVAQRQARLVIQGQLRERPQAELLWVRGRVPARALSRSRNPALWVQRRMDYMPYEYATRGVNTGALVHAFTDLQTRFGPLLDKVAIQADSNPEIEIVVRATGLNLEELPALVTTVRAIGRATLHK